jgi:hypothetical protein
MIDLEIHDEEDIRADNSRIKDVASARSIFSRMEEDDAARSRDRSRVQLNIDGAAPWNQSDLHRAKLADNTNVNFLYGQARLEKAKTPFINLLTGPESIIHIPLRTGDNEQNILFSRYASIVFHRMIRRWDGWTYNFQKCVHDFLSEGVSVAWFADHVNHKFRVSSLKEFKFAARARPDVASIEVCAIGSEWTVSELFDTIRDEEVAKDMGYDVGAVKAAIMAACATTRDETSYDEWERAAEELKANSLYMDSVVPTVKVVTMWAKGVGGKVSQYIFTKSPMGDARDNFIFSKEGVYESMAQAVIPFTHGIGTNGFLHGIRGLSWKTFVIDQLLNRLMCRRADSTQLSSSVGIIPMDEDSMATASINYRGALAIFPPGSVLVDKPIQNIGEAAGGFIADLERTANSHAAAYTSDNVFGGNRQKSRFEVAAQIEQDAEVSATNQQLFFLPLTLLLQEMFRRVKTATPEQEGWEDISWMFDECERFAVEQGREPGEMAAWIKAVDHKDVLAVQDVGNGSNALKRMYLEEIADRASMLDPVGRANAIHDWTAYRVGHESADRYAPASPVRRLPMDAQIAELQNIALEAGEQIEVREDENLIVQASVHVRRLLEYRQAVDEGEMDIAEAAIAMSGLHAHATETLEAAGSNPMLQTEVRDLNQALQQVGEIMVNGLRKARAQRENEMAVQAASGQPQDPVNREQMLKEAMLEQRIQHDNERLKMQQQKQEFDMAMDAARVRTERVKTELLAKSSLARLLK